MTGRSATRRTPRAPRGGAGVGVDSDVELDDVEFDADAVRTATPAAPRRASRENATAAETVSTLNRRPGVHVRKNHGTAAGGAGEPDLDGAILVPQWGIGRSFKIEYKAPGKAPEPVQTQRLLEWQEAGALVGWATNLTEVDEILACAADPNYRWSRGDGPGAPVA